MLKHLPDDCLKIILKLFNCIWSCGKLPQDWKHAKILAFLKPDKTPSDPSSYRPISLTSCLCKLLEKIVTKRLTFYLEENKILTNLQTGFRKGRSTIDQIMKLQDTINKFNLTRGFTVGVFIDFEKAYDMIWRTGLMAKLKRIGINGNLFAFIKNFLEDRTFQVHVAGSCSATHQLHNGTPQGSIISPILFLIMINDMEVTPGVNLSLYADDSAVYKSGNNVNALMTDIQKSLNKIETWCDQWGFTISIKKTTAVIFTHRLKFEIKHELKLNNAKIQLSKSVKFLGLIFDSKLSWKEHVTYIKEKCDKRLNLLRSVTGSQWGASKACLLTMYSALIRSVIEYGSCALSSASNSSRAVLERIQSKALRICCGAMTGTALASLQVDCGEMPLNIAQLKQQLKYLSKVKQDPDHPSKELGLDHWTNHYGNFSN